MLCETIKGSKVVAGRRAERTARQIWCCLLLLSLLLPPRSVQGGLAGARIGLAWLRRDWSGCRVRWPQRRFVIAFLPFSLSLQLVPFDFTTHPCHHQSQDYANAEQRAYFVFRAAGSSPTRSLKGPTCDTTPQARWPLATPRRRRPPTPTHYSTLFSSHSLSSSSRHDDDISRSATKTARTLNCSASTPPRDHHHHHHFAYSTSAPQHVRAAASTTPWATTTRTSQADTAAASSEAKEDLAPQRMLPLDPSLQHLHLLAEEEEAAAVGAAMPRRPRDLLAEDTKASLRWAMQVRLTHRKL